MNFKTLFLLLTIFFAFNFVSCGSDDNDKGCSVNWALDLQNEINVLNSAAQNYGQNPTTANCNAYKAAAQNYLNKLEPYGNCNTLTGQDRVDWQAAFDSARDSVNAIVC
ncbi:MAG: hypothetical protein WAT79_16870 [Saprospiraceae bacterium]